MHISSGELREWARQCEEDAKNPRISGDERDHLLRMRQALLMLVDNSDWLDGTRDHERQLQGLRNVSFHL